ncbi:hypothetical protein [Streptomyces fulvorobeus]|uniref:DUF3558 domain-containing protein n=1 Tax=Streptomyces fulvorobeus TaxID=284028 RepID=A0A7J0CGA8_9ACTN|nr:hypothetical protein [Streptomyces fulvorobeus]NYE44406.1 hypothetical protein [Streptomyces fulvorobeus]GFN00934.1 hypothetical protein Sfulv_57440 [Streptomyces fulvorobeus]
MGRARGWGPVAVALLVAGAVGCSGAADGESGNRKEIRGHSEHRWTSEPCELLEREPLVEGYEVGSTTNSADPDAQEDIGENGARPLYQVTGCRTAVFDPDREPWKLDTTARVYEDLEPALRAFRIRKDLDRVRGHKQSELDDSAYWFPVEEGGLPGRTLLMRDGNLLLTVSAYGPYGSRKDEVQETLGQIVENAAKLTEAGLRTHDASAPPPTPSR